jgi:hypothetical protein
MCVSSVGNFGLRLAHAKYSAFADMEPGCSGEQGCYRADSGRKLEYAADTAHFEFGLLPGRITLEVQPCAGPVSRQQPGPRQQRLAQGLPQFLLRQRYPRGGSTVGGNYHIRERRLLDQPAMAQ